MKRLFDITVSLFGLFCLLPLIIVFAFLVFLQDFKWPFYVAPRMQSRFKKFKMIKLRSMVINADKIGGSSTSNSDMRITPIGKLIRIIKLDELTQLWNVLKGDMSMVGPRPQTPADASLYTDEEYELFRVKPGITDFASIVFSDEGQILSGSENPDLLYNQIIRPWKSRLGIFYVNNNSLLVDVIILVLTGLGLFSRGFALAGTQKILKKLKAQDDLICVASRKNPLRPFPPPGSNDVFK